MPALRDDETAAGTKPRPLTARQHAVYSWIFAFTMEHGYQPSYREISDHFGMKSESNGPATIIAGIESRGHVEMRKSVGHSRSLRFILTPAGVPFLGFTPRGHSLHHLMERESR